MQTDPIGYGEGPNWYAYVGNDPVDYIDSLGLDHDCGGIQATACGRRQYDAPNTGWGNRDNGLNSPGERNAGGTSNQTNEAPCVQTAQQRQNSGKVVVSGVSVSAYGLLGWTLTRGSFITQSGISGRFTSIAFGVGVGVGGEGHFGAFKNLDAFVGGNDNYQLKTPVWEFTGSKDLNGNWVGGSAGSSVGPNAFALLRSLTNPVVAALSTRAAANFSSTDISNVRCPGK